MAIIDKPSDYFNTLIWTGNGLTRSITGVNFQPDFTWIKKRSSADSHHVFDVVRGAGNRLLTDSTSAEYVGSNELTAFNSDGFTVSNNGAVNGSGGTYVGWSWLGGGTAVSNTAGSITSSVSANTTAGFSVVSWTGAGAVGTIGHGLNAEPKFIITKKRNNTGNWACYHSSLGSTKYMYLNGTGASATYSGFWNNTTPTSTLISLGTDDNVTGSGDNIIAYCFANTSMIKCGSYVGNGSTDGTFVFTGMKPAFVMIKQSSTSGNGWIMMDDKRNTYNPNGDYLQANLSDAEETAGPTVTDFLSNGFKIRTASGRVNTSGATYIYLAIAEQSFVTSTTNGSIPATAR